MKTRMKVRRPTFDAFLKRQLQNPGFKKAFEAYDPEIEELDRLIAARKARLKKRKNLSQKTKIL